MASKIKLDVLQALADWKAGKPVKSIELGHVHRMKEQGGSNPIVDLTVRFSNDQERAHAYLFHILMHFLKIQQLSGVLPQDHDHFLQMCDQLEEEFRETGGIWQYEAGSSLTAEELDAAESLAWKALHVGWARAIAGHDASMYIDVTNPQAVSAT